MPDFKAISDLIGGVKNILDGVTGFAGSLGGEDLMGNLIDLGSVEGPAA
ncbi:hypothetical protein [uncultured Dietzia sp.]|nr:hypothetical protein [uncultured Dietzia sp.]